MVGADSVPKKLGSFNFSSYILLGSTSISTSSGSTVYINKPFTNTNVSSAICFYVSNSNGISANGGIAIKYNNSFLIFSSHSFYISRCIFNSISVSENTVTFNIGYWNVSTTLYFFIIKDS